MSPKIHKSFKRWQAEEKKTFAEFFRQPSTMFQVAKRTDIDRANICRYIAKLRKSNSIEVVKIDTDPLTGFKAQYFTTNPKLFRKAQLKISYVG